MNKNVCAPGTYDSKNNTCFTLDQLLDICSAYNKYVLKQKLGPNNLIHSKKKTESGGSFDNANIIKISNDKNKLLRELHDRFENICNGSDLCITKQSFMNEIIKNEYNKIVEGSFRPEGPEEAREWLSTSDIDDVLKQYEKPFNDFEFLGAIPSDCSDHKFCSLYNLNYKKKLQEGKKRLGIVFNHDKYGQSGSHWVAMFINLEKGHLYYCDSTGKKPISRIEKFIKSFETYCSDQKINYLFKKNTRKYQRDNSECGVYSCNFIIRILSGESFDEVVNNPLSFKEINLCRDKFFRNMPVGEGSTIPKMCDPKF